MQFPACFEVRAALFALLNNCPQNGVRRYRSQDEWRVPPAPFRAN
jgi:hypothetical protein